MKNIQKLYKPLSRPFDPSMWIARRYRISPAHARVVVELAGLHLIEQYDVAPRHDHEART